MPASRRLFRGIRPLTRAGVLRDLRAGAPVFTIAVGLVDVAGFRAIGAESRGDVGLALVTAEVVVLVGVEQGLTDPIGRGHVFGRLRDALAAIR